MKSHLVLARHILGAIDRIEQFSKDMSKDEFIENFLVQDGVMRNLEIIGDASRKIHAEVKAKSPEIPWKKI